MTNSKKIEAYVATQKDIFLKILGDLVNLESHTYGDRNIKNACGTYLKELFDDLGFHTKVIDAGEAGIHITGSLGSSPKRVLLVGHYDTVFPMGTTKERPFSIEANKAMGPGIFDMKGGLVSYYMAVKGLLDLELMPQDMQIDFFFNSDEEGGSKTSKENILQLAKGTKACLVAEPGHLGEGYATTERFGRYVVKITAKGIAGHAGNRPEYAANPLLELSHQMLRLEEESTKERYYSPVGLHSGDREATAMTPEEAYVNYDIRFLNDEGEKEIAKILETLTPVLNNVSLTVTGGMEKPPFYQNEANQELSKRAKKIVEEMGYTFLPTRLGGGSDGNFVASTGCATLDGLGLNGEYLHNPKEYILIDTIPARVALIAELIRTI